MTISHINKSSAPGRTLKAADALQQWRWQRATLKSAQAAGSSARYQEDRVEISTRARRASESTAGAGSIAAPPRMDRVAAIRAELAAGRYDLDAKLPDAIDRMLEREFHEFYY